MKKFFISSIFFLISNLGFSQSDSDFRYATSDTKGGDYYVYVEKTEYGSKEIWIKKIEPEKTIKNKKGKYIKTGGRHTLSFVIINCSNREFDVKQRITYDKTGNVVENNDFPSYGNKIVPGSVMSGIYDFVCNNEEETSNTPSPYVSDESNYNGSYKFKTTFNDPPFEIPLRKLPDVSSEEVYECPKKSIIYVIDNSDNNFFKVYVNGYTGYLSTGFLKRKW